uniref:Uncharacterized protein n=1 Tax=Plectus sambesii TaxID=2011161 RepID=A0A914W4C6_9BILA
MDPLVFLSLLFASAVLSRAQQVPIITADNQHEFLLLPTNFPSDENGECNVYDDASYCEDVMINKQLTTVPLGPRCTCPKDWYCPRNPTETIFEEKCRFRNDKLFWVCRMRCVPVDSFKQYPGRSKTAQP